jgi:hypothetical protein
LEAGFSKDWVWMQEPIITTAKSSREMFLVNGFDSDVTDVGSRYSGLDALCDRFCGAF